LLREIHMEGTDGILRMLKVTLNHYASQD